MHGEGLELSPYQRKGFLVTFPISLCKIGENGEEKDKECDQIQYS
jgi:hypothetical protein